MLRGAKGKVYARQIPFDLERRYDEALFHVFDQYEKTGKRLPKAEFVGTYTNCQDSPLLGFPLGFAYGLQYNYRTLGKCYINIESAIISIDLVLNQIFDIFLPWKWAAITVNFQKLIDICSALYSNCQFQELFEQFSMIFTAEGFLALCTRTIMGLGSELPLYITKYILSAETSSCIKGESMARIFTILLNWNI